MVFEYLRKYRQASPMEIEKLLFPMLPSILDDQQKRVKIRDILQEMSKKDRTIRNAGGRTRGASWKLSLVG